MARSVNAEYLCNRPGHGREEFVVVSDSMGGAAARFLKCQVVECPPGDARRAVRVIHVTRKAPDARQNGGKTGLKIAWDEQWFRRE